MGFLGQFSTVMLVSLPFVLAAHPRFLGTHIHNARAINSSYDYIIVGGGTSGLTVANRLTEDPKGSSIHSPLDQGETYFSDPSLAGGAVGTKYDWNVTGVANPQLNNRSVTLPLGKVVGGSSMLNRMVFDRGSKADYDMWRDLGNPGWGFDDLLPYFIKSETFTPPDPAIAEYNITFDSQAHGSTGPIHSSVPRWIWPSSKNFRDALTGLGIKISNDGGSGSAYGFFWGPTSLDPSKETRSSARFGPYEVAKNRTNFHLLSSQQVTKLILDSSGPEIKIEGVEFKSSSSAPVQTVTANKEVILAAGSIHTAALLQLSGIGDAAVLSKLNQTVALDLPGVGNNFHDHQYVVLAYTAANLSLSTANLTTNATFAAEAQAEYENDATGPLTTTGTSAMAFLPLSSYAKNSSSAILSAISAAPANASLSTAAPPSVVQGYMAQRSLYSKFLAEQDAASMEYLWSDPSLLIALVKPLSRGSVTITTLDPFVQPAVDWRALSDPADLQMLNAGIEFGRALYGTSALKVLEATEAMPGLATSAESYVRDTLATIYHPAGTCSMLPKDLGGVVDVDLKVYGVSNLRIVDASIMPVLPATHTSSTVYAVAEKAACLINPSLNNC
ncbi:Dehydrogenase [Lachnellula willkommii]|uniref:Dehydrogenase n=1 Tax=Lachnellula willkommii TaxID=215461 RepID=A0A559M8X7_9HELO|nr:Dehydrogenase [Lachnellula willkommii]